MASSCVGSHVQSQDAPWLPTSVSSNEVDHWLLISLLTTSHLQTPEGAVRDAQIIFFLNFIFGNMFSIFLTLDQPLSPTPPPVWKFDGKKFLTTAFFYLLNKKMMKGSGVYSINNTFLRSFNVTLLPIPLYQPSNPTTLPPPPHQLSGLPPVQSALHLTISKAKCATCVWQLGALANVDKWIELPEGFYDSAAAWQIYLLAATESCTGENRLRYTAQVALTVLLPHSLGVHAHAATKRSLTCNSSVLWIVKRDCVFCGAFLHIISKALEQIVERPWEAENVFV